MTSVSAKRNFGLDVARAISILLVLAAHKFSVEFELGLVGVQIFFILSGFLIGQILLKDFNEQGTLSTITHFWKRRWYRTLPLYYLVLTLKIIFYGNPYGWKMIIYYFFLQANLLGIDFFPVSWSLVVEEWFYLFLPLAIFIFFRKGIHPKKFLIFLAGLIVLFFVTRYLWNYFQKGIIIYQFDCLLLGVLMAVFKIHYNGVYQKFNSAVLFLIGLSGIVFFTLLLGDIQQLPVYDAFYRVTWYFLISICIFLVIPFLEQSVFFNVTLKKIRPLYVFFTWTSILTYSIYLIHMEVFRIEFNAHFLIVLAVQAVVLYGASFIVYAFYEHPMMSLRDKFSAAHYIKSIRSFSFKV